MAPASAVTSSSASTSPRLTPHEGSDTYFESAGTSTTTLPLISLTPAHLAHLNSRLEAMDPMDILRLSKAMFPGLYQSTALGLTGLVTLDMLSRIQREEEDAKQGGTHGVDVIFLDTLYHFPETYALLDEVRRRYPAARTHVVRPDGAEDVAQFEVLYGARLYEESAELYDWVAKVEPMRRACAELGVGALLTGRRRSQGGQRGSLGVVEVEEGTGLVKINPLAGWTLEQVQAYVREKGLPYNALLDRGYKSVGDWHSTSPVAEGEDERAGRWRGQDKTECGIHNKTSRYAQFLQGRKDGVQVEAA